MRIMDLKYVRSELRKLSEIVEGWNANQEIGSLERDLVLDKLRTLYEAVRFGAEAEPPAADASGQEPFPTEIPVSLDLGEVLSIESLSVAEPELPSLSGSGPEPESGFIAPLAGLPVAESGADFPDCDTAVAETVAESVLDSVPADGQEPAGVVAEPAEIPAEPAAGPIAEAEPPVAGLVSDPETPAAEEIPAPESTGNSAGKEVPAENIAAASESHGDSGSQELARVPGASGPQGATAPRDEPAHREAPSGMPEPEAIAGSGAETGVTFPAPGAGAHPAAAPQSIAPTLFGIEEETQRHRHKQRVIMSLYNPEPPAARPTAEKPAPAPAAGDAAKPVAGRPQLPTDSPATDSPEPVSGPGVSVPDTPRMFAGDEAPAEGVYAASVSQRPAPVPDTGNDDEEPDFEEITLAGNGAPNNGAVLGEVINHDKQTLADTIVPPRDMASELRRSEPVTDLRRAIGINDKFLMIRDLFDGDARAYEAALDKLDAFGDFDDCMIYIAENYAWNANSDGAKFLMELLERKFA